MSVANSLDENCAALSVVKLSGDPKRLNIERNFKMVSFDVDWRSLSISKYPLKLLTVTR